MTRRFDRWPFTASPKKVRKPNGETKLYHLIDFHFSLYKQIGLIPQSIELTHTRGTRVKGHPDIVISKKASPIKLGLEIKTPNGRPSKNQLIFQADWGQKGHQYHFCYSVDEAMRLILQA